MTTTMRSYDADDIARLAPMASVIDALRASFSTRPVHIARQHLHAGDAEVLIMPAVDTRSAGVKLLMIQPRNAQRGLPIIQGTYVLMDAESGRPVALFDGAALTQLRTPGASAVATAGLARDDARTLGIIGTGPQGVGHVAAMLVVRPALDTIVIASRTQSTAKALAERLTDMGVGGGSAVRVSAGSYAEAAGCDIVCTATRATEPIITSAMLRPGCHVNAVGAYRLDMRELSSDAVGRCTVVVDDLEAARAEAGDLQLAVSDGAWSWNDVRGDLSSVASGDLARRSYTEMTLFKSVGLAVEDLVVARLVAQADGLIS